MQMRPFGRLLSQPEALRRVLAAVRPIERSEEVPLAEALGRVAAEEYRAPRPVPEFPRATWDGYAFRSRDTEGAGRGRPVRLTVAGEVFAEQAFPRRLHRGEAVAIATGGALPAGADTVLIFEETRVEGGTLLVDRRIAPGERIATPGEDFPRGARLVRRGELLTPAALGTLASCGATRARVYASPRVGIVPNGNELVRPGGRLRPGQIFESNNLTLGAIARACGCTVRDVPPVPDDPAAIERAIRELLPTSDVVLLTGGSSVGERDFLPAVFPRLGRLLFHGISVRPGKPTLAAVAGRTLLLGMPGHPTSCLSNALWLLVPALRKLARLPGPGWVDASARLGTTIEGAAPGFATVVPLRIEDGLAYPTFHGSSTLTSLTGAHGFLLMPSGTPTLRRGRTVGYHRLLPPLAAG